MRRLKSFLLILIALWLPLQAAAAVTMPFCRHAPEPAMEAPAHCHEQAVEQIDEQAAPAMAGDIDCDNCSLCHLASAGFLLAPANELTLGAASLPETRLVAAFVSHIPEPPQQPPRR